MMPYKRNGKWMAQVRKNGQTIRKTFLSKQLAKQWEVKQKNEVKKKLKQEISSVCLLDWATSYLDFASTKFVKKTWSEKRFLFKRFFIHVDPSLLVESLTLRMVLQFLQNEKKLRSGYAANKDRKNLVAAWNWGIKYMGLSSLNPCLVDRFPEVRKTRYVPPESDFWDVYDVAATDQDKAMLLCYLHLAARRCEVFNLRWEDVDFSDSRIRLYTRKRQGGSLAFDWLPLTEDLYSSLLEHRQSSNTDWVFPDQQTLLPYLYRNKWMPLLCDKAGVKRFGLHSIRHLTASILAKENVALLDIQAILRHRNLTTTQKYIRRISSLRPVLRVLPRIKSHQQEPPKKKGLTLYSVSP